MTVTLNNQSAILIGAIIFMAIFYRHIAYAIKKFGISTPLAKASPVAPSLPSQSETKPKGDEVNLEFLITQYQQEVEKEKKSKAELEQELSRARVELEFERIYLAIWGTQIKALKRMNESFVPVKIELLGPFFDDHRKQGGPYKTCEQLLEYLVVHDLAEHTKDSYQITEKGRIFLMYLVGQGYSESKIY